jgi:hypothetical protein
MKRMRLIGGLVGLFTWQISLSQDSSSWRFPALENGDLNADGDKDLSDAVYLLNFLFTAGPGPAPILCASGLARGRNGETNGDGEIDLSDGIYILHRLFLGGSAMVSGCDYELGLGGTSADSPPEANEITPRNGLVNNPATIHGRNLQGTQFEIRFGSAITTTALNPGRSGNAITLRIPNRAPTDPLTVTVTVKVGGQETSYPRGPLSFTYNIPTPEPTLSGFLVIPSSPVVGQHSTVTVTGTNFVTAAGRVPETLYLIGPVTQSVLPSRFDETSVEGALINGLPQEGDYYFIVTFNDGACVTTGTFTVFPPAPGECIPGEVRPCGTDVGECQAGTQTCTNGTWGECTGGVGPTTTNSNEAAAGFCNGLDDNCDGTVDEGCACVPGTIRQCGTDLGECEFGAQTCTSQGTWGTCTGGVGPTNRSCDVLDHDCDGVADYLQPPCE